MDPGDGSGTEHAPDDLALTLGFVDGAHGQDLVDAGRWADRQVAMLAQCRRLVDFCERSDPGGDGVRQWQSRVRVTAGWVE